MRLRSTAGGDPSPLGKNIALPTGVKNFFTADPASYSGVFVPYCNGDDKNQISRSLKKIRWGQQ